MKELSSAEITAIIVAAIGVTGAVLTFIWNLISRHDKKKEKIAEKIEILVETTQKQQKQIDDLYVMVSNMVQHDNASELDQVRIQLLLLMKSYPENTQEILMVAARYFNELNGDWYLSSMFDKWLQDVGLEIPRWFVEHQSREKRTISDTGHI